MSVNLFNASKLIEAEEASKTQQTNCQGVYVGKGGIRTTKPSICIELAVSIHAVHDT